MNNENCVLSDQYKRIQGGILKIQNKNVCVYKGVNTVGRNKTAIINLKNLNVSQNHAVIIIVDDTQHFISDLNSSNGTYLVGTKLSPYKLYELVNDVEIKFGDVTASYFKVSNGDTTLHLENESSEMTQNMTQSFYGASTQLIINESVLNQTRKSGRVSKSNEDLEDIHELATQVVPYPPKITNKFKESYDSDNSTSEMYDKNIHEAPTQVVDYQHASTSKAGQVNGEVNDNAVGDIHEIETQVVIRAKEIIENSSIENHDSSTETCEDVSKIESLSPLKTKTVPSKAGPSLVEETVIEETVIEENWIQNDDSNDSIDFLAGHKIIENENLPSKEDTDSFLETQEVGVSKKKPVRKLSSSEDFTQPDNEKTCNSDSETDFESEVIKNKRNKRDDSGSDTEIEDDLPERFKKETKTLNSDSETDIEDHVDSSDHIPESQGVIKPKILSKKRVLDSDSDTDVEDNKEPAENKSGNARELLNDTDFIPATQDAFAEVFMYKNSTLNVKSQNLSSEESFKLGLTELMVESVENIIEDVQDKDKDVSNKEKVSSESEHDLIGENGKDIVEKREVVKVEITTKLELDQENASSISVSAAVAETKEDFYTMPTQRLNETDTKNEQILTPSTSKTDTIERDAEEDIYMMPTQKLNVENEHVSTPSTSKASAAEKEAEEDLYMMPTQKINEDNSESQFKTPRKQFNFRRKKVVLDASLSTIFGKNQSDTKQKHEKDNENEDIYLQATQKLEEDSKTDTIESDAEEDVYMMPTQKLNVENEDVSTPSTSKTSAVEKEAEEDLYMMPTQKINEDNSESQFKTPRKEFNFRRKKVVLDASLSTIFGKNQSDTQQKQEKDIENEDIYLQATQKLEENSKTDTIERDAEEDVYMMPTQKLNVENEHVSTPSTSKASTVEKEAEEDMYMMATQKINEDNSESQFKTPQKQFNFRRKKVVLDASLSTIFGRNLSDTEQKHENDNENEDIYLQATQKLKEYSQSSAYSQPTQDLNLKPNISEVTKEDEELYLAPTQKLEEINDKSEDVSKHTNEDKNATEKVEEDVYMMATQQLNDDLPPPKSDLYLEATQKIVIDQKLESNKSGEDSNLLKGKNNDLSDVAPFKILEQEDEDAYMAPTQQLCTDLVTKEVPTSSEADLYMQETQELNVTENPQADTSVKDEAVFISPTNKSIVSSGEKRKVESALNSSNVKRMRKTVEEEAETLSQIDAFVKQTFRVPKETAKVDLVSKQNPVDQSETLSQIERFIAEPFENESKTNIKALPKKRGTNKQTFATPKIEPAVKQSSSNSNELEKETLQEPNSNESKADKSDRVSMDTVKHEVEKSFALLEAKSMKTRKSKRLTDSSDVKVTLSANRRSMAVVPEPSIALESKPSTRKSSKKLTNINNNLPTIPDKTTRSKRKLEPTKKEPEQTMEESDKPTKTSRTSRAKKVKQNDEIDAVPSTSKITDKSRTANSKDSDSGSSTSIETVLSTPRRGRRTTVQSTSDIATPEKSKRKTKPKVVFTMLDSPLLESLIKQLGGSVVDNVDSSTVLVTEHVKRSQKLLAAIGQGKPICSPEWIRASKKANEFLDPWDFILLDKEAESKWNFSLKESLSRAGKEKLLGNYTFQLIVSNAADVLKGAIEACGGKCVPRYPARSTDGFFVIVSSPENRTKYTKIKKQHPQVTVVEPEAVFDGVLRQDLRLGRHLLT